MKRFVISAIFETAVLAAVAQGASLQKNVNTTISGNYEMSALLSGQSDAPQAKVFFAGSAGSVRQACLAITPQTVFVQREAGDRMNTWKQFLGPGKLPWKVWILKKGSFFRFRVNNAAAWIRGPLGEWEGIYEPRDNQISIASTGGVRVQSCALTPLPWLQQAARPVITRGPKGSFYEEQIIPGAILKSSGKYYMYFMAGMKGDEEGSSRRSIGVAVSDDLERWDVHPQPLITCNGLPYDNLYVNGAVATPEDKTAIMFSAQKYPEWKGFLLATADRPTGPFSLHRDNPVYKHFAQAHEFDLLRVDARDYRYLLFYSGFTPQARRGPDGDRGYLLTSKDLMHWQPDHRNPVFEPETMDNWDAVHARPRSLTRIGDMWYLWYEGCNTWKPKGDDHHEWWDTVGLARSKDLLRWEYYPRNPALPGLGLGPEQFDSNWVGWPRMVVREGVAYVFYTGNAQVGLRKIPVKRLTDWRSEGERTIELVRPGAEGAAVQHQDGPDDR